MPGQKGCPWSHSALIFISGQLYKLKFQFFLLIQWKNNSYFLIELKEIQHVKYLHNNKAIIVYLLLSLLLLNKDICKQDTVVSKWLTTRFAKSQGTAGDNRPPAFMFMITFLSLCASSTDSRFAAREIFHGVSHFFFPLCNFKSQASFKLLLWLYEKMLLRSLFLS